MKPNRAATAQQQSRQAKRSPTGGLCRMHHPSSIPRGSHSRHSYKFIAYRSVQEEQQQARSVCCLPRACTNSKVVNEPIPNIHHAYIVPPANDVCLLFACLPAAANHPNPADKRGAPAPRPLNKMVAPGHGRASHKRDTTNQPQAFTFSFTFTSSLSVTDLCVGRRAY